MLFEPMVVGRIPEINGQVVQPWFLSWPRGYGPGAHGGEAEHDERRSRGTVQKSEGRDMHATLPRVHDHVRQLTREKAPRRITANQWQGTSGLRGGRRTNQSTA